MNTTTVALFVVITVIKHTVNKGVARILEKGGRLVSVWLYYNAREKCCTPKPTYIYYNREAS